MIEVAALRVAPVKGLSTVVRDRIEITRNGVREDRRLFVVTADGTVVTLRSHPTLVRVVPDLDLERGVLTLTAPQGRRACANLDDLGLPLRTQLFGKQRSGRVLGGDASSLLSHIAGEDLRLVLADGDDAGWDQGPVSLVGRSSARAVGGADPARYRMVVELDGTQPFAEDSWIDRTIAVDAAVLRVRKAVPRCVIITQSPLDGTTDWDGLREIRRVRGQVTPTLGVIADVVEPGRVRTGAGVTVH